MKSDNLGGNKYLITCSQQPNPDLKVSEVSAKSNQVRIVSQASDDLCDQLNGFNSLALNPLGNDIIASSSRKFVKSSDEEGSGDLGSVQLWKLTEESLTNQAVSLGNKR